MLTDILPPDYFRVLADVAVPAAGGKVLCPLTGHVERTASCHVWATAERGWHCFGCNRGGTIFDLAAALWGMPTRGPAFTVLRQQLERTFHIPTNDRSTV